MDINTTELDFITDKLTAAHTRPLEERIAQLENENRQMQELLAQGKEAMAVQGMALAAKDLKIQELMAEVQRLRKEQQQQEMNVWVCQQYIPLSKPATQAYVVNLTDNHDRAFLAHFFMQTLPKDAPRQLTDEVTQMTQLPEPLRPHASVTHNHYEAGSASQVFNGEVSGATFTHPHHSIDHGREE